MAKDNTGIDNTGNCNTGYWNTGNRNTGDCNTGYWNTGNRNTGYCNTGNCNTGYWNTGNCNTGYWNTGNRNTGYCNTDAPNVRIFNKDTGISFEDFYVMEVFPNYFFFETTEWIYEANMTDKEKEDNPTYKTTGGYLKTIPYLEAWRQSWDKASLEDRKKTLTIPNFDNALFKEISGIDVEKELSVRKDTIKIGDMEYDKEEVESRLKGLKPIE